MKTLFITLLIHVVLLGNDLEENNTYLYDVSMFPEDGAPILPCPEIKIRFNDEKEGGLNPEEFKPGGKLYLRLNTKSQDYQSLFWYYPPIHDRNISLKEKLKRKIKKIRFRPKIKKFKIKSKSIPYLTLRRMSDDILGNARSKVGSKISFLNNNTELQISIEDSISYDDFLRLRGLKLAAENRGEVGPTIVEFRKDGDEEWQQLSGYEFVIGKASIKDIIPKRFIRMEDKQYQLSLEIETGYNPTIKEDDSLIVKLSEDLDADWVSVDAQTVIVKGDGKDQAYSVVPEVLDSIIIFPVAFEIPPKSHLVIPNLRIKPTTGPRDQLSIGSISIHTELTGNLDDVDASMETQLGEKSEPILFMYPSLTIEEQDLLFYTKSDTEPAVGIRINTEQDSYLESGDIVKIVIPKEVGLNWGNISSELRKQKFEISKTDHKTIKLDITQYIGEPITLDKIPFEVPSGSIPLFQLECYFSFAPDSLSLPVKGKISFGQPTVAMEKSKLINRLQGVAFLNDITITEDKLVTTLKPGDEIEIIGDEDYFSFNTARLTNIVISDLEGFNQKITVNYQQCTAEKIVLMIRSDLNRGESIVIKNIPVADIYETGGDIFLEYNFKNKKCALTEHNNIRIIDLSLEIAKDQEFLRDVSNLNGTFSLGELSVDIKGQGKLFDKGKRLELSLPEESADWTNINKVNIFPSGRYSISQKNSRTVVLTLNEDIYNEETIYINNLSIRPTVKEFINELLKITAVEDTNVFAKSSNSITYSYPSLRSGANQVFFTDDTSWKIYNIDINTRDLNNTIFPGSKISILLSNNSVSWDTKYNVIRIKSENARKLKRIVEFEGQACHIVAKDTISAHMSFEISGLRIQPVKTPDIEFSLELSLDGGKTICALDFDKGRFKYVKPSTDYNGKINRSIEESAYAMGSRKRWIIKIPDLIDYKWDTAAKKIERVFKNGMPIGNINFRSLNDNVEFPDNKTAKISIENGYGRINQGLQISGQSKKKLIFKGLKILRILQNDPDISNSYLELIVETPFGDHVVNSDKSKKSDWGLKINNRTSFPIDKFVKKELEIAISMPQIKRFGGKGVLDDTKLLLYSKEPVLLLDPLVKRFNGDDKQKAKKDVITSADYIKKFYDDTDPKGNNWKVWYYLAYAKWRAVDLGILEELKDRLKDDQILIRRRYNDDMEKAKRIGYDPAGRHKDAYPIIDKDNLLAKINNKISIAAMKFSKGDMIGAEEDFLKILSDSKKDDKIKHLSAVANYWLGRIALALDDTDYDDYRRSYPFARFKEARIDYKSYPEALFSGTLPVLEVDSINVYRDLAKKRVKSHSGMESVSMKRQTRKEGANFFSMENTFHFIYNYDNNYTFKIEGNSGATIGLVNPKNTDLFLAKGNEMYPLFGDEIRLNLGGDYSVVFSPKKQTFINFFASAILIGIIGFGYG